MMLSLRHLRGGIMYKDWASQLGSPLLHRDAYFSICTILLLNKICKLSLYTELFINCTLQNKAKQKIWCACIFAYNFTF